MYAIHDFQHPRHLLADLCHRGWELLSLVLAWRRHGESTDDDRILWDDGEPPDEK